MANGDFDGVKQRLIDKAREQANAGAHYLWSTAGNTPGNKDGAWYRPLKAELHPNVPDLDQFNSGDRNSAAKRLNVHAPMLFGAFAHTSDFGLLACGGRPVMFTATLAIAAMQANIKSAFDLKWKNITSDQLDELIANAKKPADFRWPRPNSSISNNSTHHSTIWGESCVGKRHFDCIGFINWCLSEVLNKKIQYGISNYVAKKIGTEVSVRKAQPCDIVTIGAKHIGLVSERNTVIEAKDVINGVVEGAISAGLWTNCFRLPNSMWT